MTPEHFILQRYNCIKTGKDGIYRLTCPFCRNQAKKFYFLFNKGFYNCFHCGKSDSIRNFIYEFHRSDIDIKSIDFKYNKISRQFTDDKNPVLLPEDFKPILEADTTMGLEYLRYVYNRGISNKIISQANIGYSATFSYYVIFPVYDENSRQVYFTNRYIGTNKGIEKTYNPSLSFSNSYSKSSVLYNINRAVYKKDILYIVEGVFSCLSMMSVDLNCVATLGKTISDEQIEIINANDFNSVVLCYDGDAMDKNLLAAYRLQQYTKCKIYTCTLPDKKDPNNLLIEGSLLHYTKQIEPYSRLSSISKKINCLLHKKS